MINQDKNNPTPESASGGYTCPFPESIIKIPWLIRILTKNSSFYLELYVNDMKRPYYRNPNTSFVLATALIWVTVATMGLFFWGGGGRVKVVFNI